MINKQLVKDVVWANKELLNRDLVIYSWGNVSAIDREAGLIVIKPVGIPYDELTEENISIVDLEGKKVSGPLNPSVDLPIHMALYNNFAGVSAIAHTHSTYATIMAQTGRSIPCYGTTHADYFYGEVPCAPALDAEKIRGAYEWETGMAIVEQFNKRGYDPVQMPAVLSASHGPFTWGDTAAESVHRAVVLEEVAKMAWGCQLLQPDLAPIPQVLLDRHFLRKHGPDAYFNNDDYGKGMVSH